MDAFTLLAFEAEITEFVINLPCTDHSHFGANARSQMGVSVGDQKELIDPIGRRRHFFVGRRANALGAWTINQGFPLRSSAYAPLL